MKFNSIYIIFLGMFLIYSCKREEAKTPQISNAQEQITTVHLYISSQLDSSEKVIVKWRDLDGDGGNSPISDTIQLKKLQNYQCELVVLDESKSSVDTISHEILSEADVHRFFFYPSDEVKDDIKITYLDFDTNNQPLGLNFLLQTTALNASLPLLGKLNILLSHYDGIQKVDSPSPESDLNIFIPIRISE